MSKGMRGTWDVRIELCSAQGCPLPTGLTWPVGTLHVAAVPVGELGGAGWVSCQCPPLPPAPSPAVRAHPPVGAYLEAELGVHIHLVQRVHLVQAESTSPSPTRTAHGHPSAHLLPSGTLGSSGCPSQGHSHAPLWAGAPWHPKARTLHLLLLVGRGVGDVMAGCSLRCCLPPAEGGPRAQGAAGTQHHRHLVLDAGAVVVEVHRGPQLRAICGAWCQQQGMDGHGDMASGPQGPGSPPCRHSQAAGWSWKGQRLLRGLSWWG